MGKGSGAGLLRRGRTALRYQLDIIPRSAEELPDDLEHVSLVWERGGKLSYTEAEPVDRPSKSAEFKQIMRQSATLYRQDNAFLPKEYIFKLQAVRAGARGSEKRKTLCRGRLDLSQYCSYSPHPETQDVRVQLEPRGSILLNITTTWLQHATSDERSRGSADSATERLSTGLASQGASSSEGDLAVLNNPFLATSGTTATPPRLPAGSYAAASPAASGSSNPFLAASKKPGVLVSRSAPASAASSPNAAGAAAHVDGGLQLAPQGLVSRHRRISSSPGLPDVAEGEKEGLAAADSATSDRLVSAGSATSAAQRAASGSGVGSRGAALVSSAASSHSAGRASPAAGVAPSPADAGARAVSPAADSVAALVEESLRVLDSDVSDDEGDTRQRGTLTSWLGGWGFGQQGSKASSEELLRTISSTTDVSKLQTLARNLLAERNDWRLKATELEAAAAAARNDADVALRQKGCLAERLAAVEAQVQQMKENALLEQLVETKMALAQADFAATSLRGQLNQERSRARELAARLTAMQSQHDRLLNQHVQETAAAVVAVTAGGSQEARKEGGPDPAAAAGSASSVAGAVCSGPDEREGSVVGPRLGGWSMGRLLGFQQAALVQQRVA